MRRLEPGNGQNLEELSMRFITSVFVLLLASCTSMTPHRAHLLTEDDCAVRAISGCETGAYYLQPASDTIGYDIPIGIVEFDDQGSLMRPDFKNAILDNIQDLANESPLLMVIFAHGWKNNAAVDNNNLRDFEEILYRLAQHDKQVCTALQCANRKVVGVYLGWRGLSATVEPFKTLSFWNRKKRAQRVGQDGATEVLAELAKVKATRYKEDERDNHNKLIAVGHSFGGALLFNALQQQLIRDTAFQRKNGTILRNAAQLVVLVNPAFEAARTTALHERAAALTFNDSQRPILAVFTSETDKATKYAFPAGRFFSTLFTKYNKDRADQSSLDTKAIGHYPAYQTHSLEIISEASDFPTLTESNCNWKSYQFGETDTWNLNKLALKRTDLIKSGDQKNNPYLNVAVDTKIIADHNKIWGQYFMDFLYHFVAVQDMRSCDSTTGKG